MSNIYVGIDPGKSGGYAIFGQDGEVLSAAPLPLSGNELDIPYLQVAIQSVRFDNAYFAIEKVGAMPGQGVTSMFSFGFNVGLLHGMVRGSGWHLQTVTPQTWQKATCGATKGDKDVTAAWASRMFPKVSLIPPRCRVSHSGITDALGIGYWLYQYHNK